MSVRSEQNGSVDEAFCVISAPFLTSVCLSAIPIPRSLCCVTPSSCYFPWTALLCAFCSIVFGVDEAFIVLLTLAAGWNR